MGLSDWAMAFLTPRPAHTHSKIESRLRRVNDAELWLLAAVLGIDMAGLFPSGSRRKPPASFIAVARRSEDWIRLARPRLSPSG
jgi:hypothetical protein